jgi:hypothetical protein
LVIFAAVAKICVSGSTVLYLFLLLQACKSGIPAEDDMLQSFATNRSSRALLRNHHRVSFSSFLCVAFDG